MLVALAVSFLAVQEMFTLRDQGTSISNNVGTWIGRITPLGFVLIGVFAFAFFLGALMYITKSR